MRFAKPNNQQNAVSFYPYFDEGMEFEAVLGDEDGNSTYTEVTLFLPCYADQPFVMMPDQRLERSGHDNSGDRYAVNMSFQGNWERDMAANAFLALAGELNPAFYSKVQEMLKTSPWINPGEYADKEDKMEAAATIEGHLDNLNGTQ